MRSLTSLLMASYAASFVAASPPGFSKRQAGDWKFHYYWGDDHACSTSPSQTSTTYHGGIGCVPLSGALSPDEAPDGGSVKIELTGGGAVTPKLWFDIDCTDPVELVQITSNPTCWAVKYNFNGGPVAISADQAGA